MRRSSRGTTRKRAEAKVPSSNRQLGHVEPNWHLMLHVAPSRQFLVHVAEVQFPVQAELSSQSKLHVPPVQARSHFAPRSHSIVHVSPGGQKKLQVLPSLHVQSGGPHAFRSSLPPLSVPDDVPASVVVVPLDPPPLVLVPPPELDVDVGAPLPIVQSYEHAPAMSPPTATTDRTEKRCCTHSV